MAGRLEGRRKSHKGCRNEVAEVCHDEALQEDMRQNEILWSF